MPVRQFITLIMSLSILVPFYESPAIASACPKLTILLDTSGSMLEAPAGPALVKAPVADNRKYSIAAVEINKLVAKYEAKLPIGLSLFPTDGVCGAANLNIAPALYTKQPISDLLAKSAPANFSPDTPTAASISSLAGLLKPKEILQAQYIILVTDGLPECNNGTNPESVEGTIKALTDAASGSPPIKTFLVTFSERIEDSSNMNRVEDLAKLNRMADAGGMPTSDGNYHFYRVTNTATLAAALDTILNQFSKELGECTNGCSAAGCVPGYECIDNMCQEAPGDGGASSGLPQSDPPGTCRMQSSPAGSPLIPLIATIGMAALLMRRRRPHSPPGASY